MRDGVALALDVYLPSAARPGQRFATILHQTRYYRGVQLRGRLIGSLAPQLAQMLEGHAHLRRSMVARGFAWVDVCVRGSGASLGRQLGPWWPEEVADGRELVDWIIGQPWSSGRVGATGISYAGTSAEFLLVHRHPAVRAVAPLFAVFDVYGDVAFPGGVHLARFTEQWARFGATLDRHAFDEALALILLIQLRAMAAGPELDRRPALAALARQVRDTPRSLRLLRGLVAPVAGGVRPVPDAGGLLAAALRDHAGNADVHLHTLQVSCRDDAVGIEYEDAGLDRTMALFSPAARAAELEASGVPIFGVTGWYDAAYQHAAIRRFLQVRTPGSQLLIGPWHHGGRHDISPFRGDRPALLFDHERELGDFFARHLRDEETAQVAPVRYYTLREERWKEAGSWPPPDFTRVRWQLRADGSLAPGDGGAAAAHELRSDTGRGTGPRARWDSLLPLFVPVMYPDRAARERGTPVYRSAPLDRPLEVTGHPVLRVMVRSTSPDLFLFAYLEDESPGGDIWHVTEGQLRALHRAHAGYEPTGVPRRSFRRAAARPLSPGEPCELLFDLLPVSWRFAAGHRLRLALAGADDDHFAAAPHARCALQVGGSDRSYLELPVRQA